MNGTLEIRFRRTHPNATMPAYGSDGAAGLDLYALEDGQDWFLGAGGRTPLRTGIAVEIPPGYEGQIRPRSGLALKYGVMCSFGTIDSDFRGELWVTLFNHSLAPYMIKGGDRIAQLVIVPVPRIVLVETDSLSATARGEKGWGSSGR